MTVGNLPSEIRNKPSNGAVLLVALLPAEISTDPDAFHTTLGSILQELNNYPDGVKLLCPDGMRRLCFLRIPAWLADHQEYTTLYSIKSNLCPVCEVAHDQLGNGPGETFKKRDYGQYAVLFERKKMDKLRSIGVELSYNAFWGLTHINPVDLWKPDTLHVIYLGIFKHLMQWITDFLKYYKKLDLFDKIWKNLETFPGIYVPRKAYTQISQWQGKEMRGFMRIILPCLVIALRNPTSSQREHFEQALKCTRNLVDFSLMVSYKSHSDKTIRYMEDFLKEFHSLLPAFLRFRANKRTNKRAKDAARLLREELKEARKGSNLTRSQRQAALTTDQKTVTATQTAMLEEESHFNFPKLHLLMHFPESIKRFGSIPQWSTDITEKVHKEIKTAYNSSNCTNDYEKQIIEFHGQRQAFRMRRRNLNAQAEEDGLHEDGLADVLDLLNNTTRRH